MPAWRAHTHRLLGGTSRAPHARPAPGPRGEQPPPSERQDGLVDDLHRLLDLVLLDDERRGQPDDVAVRRLGQQPVVSESQAHLPRVVVWRETDTPADQRRTLGPPPPPPPGRGVPASGIPLLLKEDGLARGLLPSSLKEEATCQQVHN